MNCLKFMFSWVFFSFLITKMFQFSISSVRIIDLCSASPQYSRGLSVVFFCGQNELQKSVISTISNDSAISFSKFIKRLYFFVNVDYFKRKCNSIRSFFLVRVVKYSTLDIGITEFRNSKGLQKYLTQEYLSNTIPMQ